MDCKVTSSIFFLTVNLVQFISLLLLAAWLLRESVGYKDSIETQKCYTFNSWILVCQQLSKCLISTLFLWDNLFIVTLSCFRLPLLFWRCNRTIITTVIVGKFVNSLVNLRIFFSQGIIKERRQTRSHIY